MSPTSDVPATTAAPADPLVPADSSLIPIDSTVPIDSTLPVDSTAPADSTTPVDSTAPADPAAPGDTLPTISPLGGSTVPGIVFGTVQIHPTLLNSVHTGTVVGGEIDPSNVLSYLSTTRLKGGRIVIKLSKGRDSFIQNADGTFSFTKWKALVDRFRSVNLGPYIADGTILGHFLIDEPHRTAKWGGKIIPQSTIEAMAKYSKQIWPGMHTFARIVPSWLAGVSQTYTYLDAGWLQYETFRGDVSAVLTKEVAAAKSKGLGLVVGLNVLDGGNGSSKIAGWSKGKYAMSASEIRKYGAVLLNNSFPCGFYSWMYSSGYYGRSDIKSAMAELSIKARNHAKTSCRQ